MDRNMRSVFLVSSLIVPVHAVTIVAFIIIGGFLASLNHTRYDIIFPYFPSVYQVYGRMLVDRHLVGLLQCL
jgi:sterol desaturase/sphingolipid hydroxylase (fatty acid hydroxylase superfamily)